MRTQGKILTPVKAVAELLMVSMDYDLTSSSVSQTNVLPLSKGAAVLSHANKKFVIVN